MQVDHYDTIMFCCRKYIGLDVIEVSSDEDTGCKSDSDDGQLASAVMQSLQEHKYVMYIVFGM